MLVVDGELVAVTKRAPGHVIGDGEHTIAELVDIVNPDPRRGIGHEKVLTRIELDAQAQRMLERAGADAGDGAGPRGDLLPALAPATCRPAARRIDVTDVVHPDNREMAVRAVRGHRPRRRRRRLPHAGHHPELPRVGGGICEVNAAPGFRMHVAPTEGKPRDVAGPVIDMLFPPGRSARVPIAAITGTNGKTTTARMLAHIHKMNGFTSGLATTDGVYIDGQRTVQGDMTGPKSARMVLARSAGRSRGARDGARRPAARRHGRAATSTSARCSTCRPITSGMKGIDTLEQLAEVKRIVVEVASDCAVLNADDPLAAHGRLHRGGAHLLRDDESAPRRWCASTSARAASRACSRRASTAR